MGSVALSENAAEATLPPLSARMANFIKDTQQHIVSTIERVDGVGKFRVDKWRRDDGTDSQGISCVMQDGKVFEKAGVMVSVLHGVLPRGALRSGPFRFYLNVLV